MNLEPNCDYCELVFEDKTIGKGLCGKCPYNTRMIPHFKPHPAALAVMKLLEPDAATPSPNNK